MPSRFVLTIDKYTLVHISVKSRELLEVNRALQIQRIKNAPARSYALQERSKSDWLNVSLVAIFEVEVPPAVVPFESHLPPAKRHLRIGIEWSDVGPRLGRVLSGVSQRTIVWVR